MVAKTDPGRPDPPRPKPSPSRGGLGRRRPRPAAGHPPQPGARIQGSSVLREDGGSQRGRSQSPSGTGPRFELLIAGAAGGAPLQETGSAARNEPLRETNEQEKPQAA